MKPAQQAKGVAEKKPRATEHTADRFRRNHPKHVGNGPGPTGIWIAFCRSLDPIYRQPDEAVFNTLAGRCAQRDPTLRTLVRAGIANLQARS